ncbi:MAG: Rpn family recombination-promoting nuclease/putative transposase [Sedimentibacter sp.]
MNEEEIDEIQYIDTHTLKEYVDDKYIVMDVRLLLKDKCEIDIEMQVMNFRYWTNRVMYYSSRMLSEQLKRGQDYGKFIKCVSISILDFNIFDKNSYPGYYSSYHVREDIDGRTFSDLLEFHVIELPKIPEVLIEDLNDDLLIWAKFINSKNREEMITLTEKNEGIKAAFDELVSLENDDERRQEYKIREKAIMDYKVQNRAAREEGIKEGIKKGKLLTAKNMLNDGLSLEFISRATELPTEKIKELQNEIDEKAN